MEGLLETSVDVRPDGIAIITFRRPEQLNAFTRLTADEVEASIKELEEDDAVKAIILTGEGRGFCAGASIGGYDPTEGPAFESPLYRYNQGRSGWMRGRFSLAETIYQCRKPVIAAVNGVAVGMGMGIAMACDVRIASHEARFNAMFVRRGLASDYGLAFFLREIVGRSKALELLWRADFISAEEALQLGLVTRVVPANDLIPACVEFLGPVLAHPPLAIETIKSLVNFGDQQRLSEYMLAEEALQIKLKDYSEDTREAARAFIERREPVFRGR